MDKYCISRQTLERLPAYLNYLKSLPQNQFANVSATFIAKSMGLNHVQVRKDLAQVSSRGRPKLGYVTRELIDDIKNFLGYNKLNDAVLIGVGKLGGALLSYDGFAQYGLNIVAGFDVNPKIIGSQIADKQIFSMDKLKNLCERMKIHLAIITVPEICAQNVCDILIDCGITGILNFASTHLNVPENILVQHENLALCLAVLSNHLAQKYK